MRYFSVCSGVEAASLAWMPLGWEAFAFSELEPFPCAVLAERFPNVPNLGDMTKISITENGEIHGAATTLPNDGDIDLIVGGTPCQDASVAGKRAGLVEGSRSKLAFDFARLAYELAAYRGLRWIVWENVPGVFSLNKGWDFAMFLSSVAGRHVEPPKDGWGTFGIVPEGSRGNFGLCWRVLDVQYCRVDGFPRAIPQRRRRIFLVGYIGDWRRAAEVLFEPSSLCGDNPPKRSKRKDATADAGGCVEKADGCLNPHDTQSSRIFGKDGSFHSINANSGGGMMRDGVLMTNSNGGDVMPAITAVEYKMGKNQKDTNGGYVLSIGNGQDNPNSGIHEADVAKTLDTTTPTPQKAQGGQMILESFSTYDHHPQDGRVTPSDVTHIDARAGTGGGNLPLVASFMGGQGSKAEGIAYTENVSATIKAAPSGSNQVPDMMCVHGSQDPISNTEHANAVNRNNGLENCVAIPINSMVIGKDIKEGDRQTTGIGNEGDPCPILQTEHHHAVAQYNDNHKQENKEENDYGNAKETRSIEILRILRSKIGKEAFCEWAARRLKCFHEKEVLQSDLHGESVRCETDKEESELDDSALPCKKNDCEESLRNLWGNFKLGYTSQGQGLEEQFIVKLDVRLSKLSYQDTPRFSVRRLLPIETERLMGFPDNWTKIPWRGKPAEECPDAPRYKACGNSMGVNCMRWIGLGIEAVENRYKE